MKHIVRTLAAILVGVFLLATSATIPARAAAPAYMSRFSNEVSLTYGSKVDINFGLHSGRWLNIKPGHNLSEPGDYAAGFYIPNRCRSLLYVYYPNGNLLMTRTVYGPTDWFGMGPNMRYYLSVSCW